MTIRNVLCVILIQGFLVYAFPTSDGDSDGDPGVVIELPVSGITDFHGTAPATGSVTIFGHAPCNDPELPASFLNPNSLILPQTVEKDDRTTFTEFDETSTAKFQDFDEMNNVQIPKKVILGAILADSIMAEKGAEINVKLAELDAFVESELGTIGPIIKYALSNADTSEMDSKVDSTLLEMESQISSQLTTLDEFLEAELSKTEEIVESVISNVEAETEENRDIKVTHTELVESAEKDALIGLELAMLESFVESTLEQSESFVESELEKVNALVESELGKIDFIVESQLDQVDMFIEKELEKTDAFVKSEMLRMESFVENELGKVEKQIEVIADSGTAGSNAVLIISNSDGNNMEQTNEDQARTVVIEGIFPVSGKTLIIGSTGCPPPFPTREPLPLYVESFPVFENVHDEIYGPVFKSDDIVYDDVEDGCTIELPVEGKVVFSGVAPATGTCKIQGTFSCDSLPSINNHISPPMVGDANPKIPLNQASDPYNKQYFTISENNGENAGTVPVLYHKEQLPIVNILRNCLSQKPTGAVIVKGDVKFNGNSEAVGGTSLHVNFPCPPLTATEVGPDGKKYIWIAKKPCNKDTPSKQEQPPNPKPDFPTYTEDFPETVIMDANKNYEKHINESLDVDFGLLGSLPVAPGTF